MEVLYDAVINMGEQFKYMENCVNERMTETELFYNTQCQKIIEIRRILTDEFMPGVKYKDIPGKVSPPPECVLKSDQRRRSPNKNELMCSTYEDGVLLHGSTYDVKEKIKEYGGFWSKLMKGWVVSVEASKLIIKEISIPVSKEKVENRLESYGLDLSRLPPPPSSSSASSSTKKKTKKTKKKAKKSKNQAQGGCIMLSESD
jgi:hypothetical protein